MAAGPRPTVRDQASLHESTVQKIAAGELRQAPKKRRRGGARSGQVRADQVDPRVLETAKKLAGPHQRVVIEDARTVWVVNRREG